MWWVCFSSRNAATELGNHKGCLMKKQTTVLWHYPSLEITLNSVQSKSDGLIFIFFFSKQLTFIRLKDKSNRIRALLKLLIKIKSKRPLVVSAWPAAEHYTTQLSATVLVHLPLPLVVSTASTPFAWRSLLNPHIPWMHTVSGLHRKTILALHPPKEHDIPLYCTCTDSPYAWQAFCTFG